MLRCAECSRTYGDRWRCKCGGPLDFADPPLPDGPPPDPIDAHEGLWAFAEFLPVGHEVSLGEGFTPLVDAPSWNCEFKLEYVSPTGSFKDRGATVTLSRAADLGVERILEDTSGNAGAAIATYAARAGIDARIYVPADVTESKLQAIRRTGSEVVRVEGSREAVTEACIGAVEAGDGWYASHTWNPAFFVGTATFAYEVAARRDWSVPDAVVTPLGHGTLFLGAYQGFRALQAAGWTDRIPRLLGAQAAGVAPVVEALDGREAATGDNDLAGGIQIRDPVRMDQIIEAIDATDGDATAVGAAVTEREIARLHRKGFYVEPTSAVATAALREFRDQGVLAPHADVVVALTGSGLKT